MKQFKVISLLLLIPILLLAQPQRVITDSDIPVGSTVTFSSDTVYVLSGMVFVDSLATLTIEAGTLIKAEDGQDTEASGLVVTRDGKIYAEGTAERPIIFTSINDNMDGNLAYDDRGEWAGVVLLGRSITNNGEIKSVEGVNEIDPVRARYGSETPDENHSSGVFRYVSIRHTGINVGSSTGNEIQGLTCGAVGAGTVIEYVESYASGDDGFEFFGGTANTRYLVSAFCSDDAFDWDQGFNGKHQFWFAIQAPDAAGRIAEMDGAGGNEQGTPYAMPKLSNVTYIGPGLDATPEGDGGQALIFRDNTGGFYYNSIITDFNGFEGGLGVTVEDIDNSGEKVEDSRKRFEAGELGMMNNIWYGFGAGNTITEFSDQDFVQSYLSDAANGNRVVDPMLKGISRETDGGLDPRPSNGSPALSGSMEVGDDWFVKTSYVGAFGGNNWLLGWTALDQLGYLTQPTIEAGTRIITDSDIPVGSTVTFSSDTVYVLSGMVFVDSLATLTIEAGTLIKAEDGQDTEASGLVVTRDGKIYAEGTAERPIIFTSINDNMDGNLAYDDRGEWAGVVLLGRSITNNGEIKSVEGVNEIDPVRARYGSETPDENHSSGVFRYVSIRHTGINVGSSTGNEIQGLTCGAVGAGTVIEYVESYASGDDGFEFFGGTANTRYLVSAFCSDDAFDWDQGFNGKHQFWFAIQAPDAAGRIAEMDGAGGNEQGTPYAMPKLSNVTYIGPGLDATPEGDGGQALIFRDNTGGFYYNSIITDFNGFEGGLGVTVEDIDNSGEKVEDSRKRFEAGELGMMNNIWYGFGAGNTITEFSDQDFVQSYLSDAANGNRVVDPMLKGISRETDGGLDPRPSNGSPALSGSMEVGDDWFVKTSYVGAFGGNNWLLGWTALDQLGYTDNLTAVEETFIKQIPNSFELAQNYPNPFNPSTTITFALPKSSEVQLNVYNILGEQVAQLVNEVKNAGTYSINWDASNLASGTYIYRLQAGNNVIVNKMILLK
ncbi:MAG: T9SS type A sorting domain-containing protein [Ignavibacteriales bacterium]|nr:T9SS type A sorting domain-containing protein [Ignavibacteriales bacterium]